MESYSSKAERTSGLVWQRAATGRSKVLKCTDTTSSVTAPPSKYEPASQGGNLPEGSGQPVAFHTHSYTYVFNRLTHHTHRIQLRRTFCEGSYGGPRAEPNSAFYAELDERLRLQASTLTAVRNKLVVESLAAAQGQMESIDTVTMRQAVNSSLTRQMEFFTSCLERYCGVPSNCACTCQGNEGGSSPGRLAKQMPPAFG
ncbi:hypothetical protein Vretimale_14081 [Volvox reticuliferus]|uniref:Uncharacterized protein n=1 Tax=Volvox reticuliferus TaxID=1737510 RepID=A0A8J4GNM8_9CHLO|nr:hypothetical protein Vretifemale_16250 [Volvox reticuliferus]GIM10306.1 hypothetical protein Vretimale_14081 [Volvox reticuliferus]